ncbi:MAG: hypothetical protein WC050_01575 [Candidatus Paceibacterota bacterium]
MAKPLSKDFVANKHIGLSIEKPAIPDLVRTVAAENGLVEKSEMHISVLVTKNAQALWRALGAQSDAAAPMQKVEELFQRYAWEYTLTQEYFLHERFYTQEILNESGDIDHPEHLRRTIVQKVLLPDLLDFYASVNVLAATSFTVPVPHITLFSLDGRGIGINSSEEFEKFTKRRLVL